MPQLEVRHNTTLVECVAVILISGEHVLAEKRKLTKVGDPGAIMLPGGHIEYGECPEEAFYREMLEELGIVPCSHLYVCTLLHKAQEIQKIHYFAVDTWKGGIENHEAESLLWVPILNPKEIENGADRVAIQEFLRIYAQADHPSSAHCPLPPNPPFNSDAASTGGSLLQQC